MAWMVFGDRRSGTRSCWVTLGLSRDFTETQRERFLGARTHVASLIRHADARRRLADVMVALDADQEVGASGIVLLGPTLRVERASPAARRTVARWFGRFGSALPEELADWLRSPFPREPHSIERGGLRLVVETPTRGALILREEHLASASLTTREREVLSCVADGLSTSEIAHALWLTPATVSKHLEHIYRKLGVTGRTGALAALRRTRTTEAERCCPPSDPGRWAQASFLNAGAWLSILARTPAQSFRGACPPLPLRVSLRACGKVYLAPCSPAAPTAGEAHL